ncbi:hypothetical protein WMY93_030677 [Mugilogobius chulae]|uniref:Fibronectin type-III domain-containing protein n=1 Tax=Mugilogobius chulae TaxID=88201 RepID=A0AAW0MN84_9GOBI
MDESEAAASKKTEEEEVEEEFYETLQELEYEKAHVSDIPTPKVSVVSVGPDVVSFTVEPHSSPQTFDLVVDYCAAQQKGSVVHKDCPHVDIQGLCPGTEYMFTITRRLHSSQTCVRVATAPIPPPPLSVHDIRTDSVTLSWEPPAGQVKNYTVSCCSEEEMIQELQTEETSVTIRDLRPAQQYVFSVCAQLQNGHKSEPARISAGTKTRVQFVLENLNLEKHFNKKLCLNKMLQIDEKTMTENDLVDGDASNIPLRWVSDVLTQLHDLVSPNNKILVITVLGVQSTGKSTLLNTMFGVQFAVSSGRCTRGAFMLLIRISEDMKATLKCDFLVIIDTEGLKSPELLNWTTAMSTTTS